MNPATRYFESARRLSESSLQDHSETHGLGGRRCGGRRPLFLCSRSRAACRSSQTASDRSGIAAVELAFVAPLFLVLLLGLMQVSMLFDAYNLFSMAAREGARSALFEREGFIPEGVSTNLKVEQDVMRFLEAHGYESEHLDVTICFPDQPDRLFDLDDEANALQLFEVRIGFAMEHLLYTPPPGVEDQRLLASVVFRNSPGRLVQ